MHDLCTNVMGQYILMDDDIHLRSRVFDMSNPLTQCAAVSTQSPDKRIPPHIPVS